MSKEERNSKINQPVKATAKLVTPSHTELVETRESLEKGNAKLSKATKVSPQPSLAEMYSDAARESMARYAFGPSKKNAAFTVSTAKQSILTPQKATYFEEEFSPDINSQLKRVDKILDIKEQMSRPNVNIIQKEGLQNHFNKTVKEFHETQKFLLGINRHNLNDVLQKDPNTIARMISSNQSNDKSNTQTIDPRAVLVSTPYDQWDKIAKISEKIDNRTQKPTMKQAVKDFANKVSNAFANLKNKGVKNKDIETLYSTMEAMTEKMNQSKKTVEISAQDQSGLKQGSKIENFSSKLLNSRRNNFQGNSRH